MKLKHRAVTLFVQLVNKTNIMLLGAWMVAIQTLIQALQTPHFHQTVKTKKPFTSCFFLNSISKRVLAYKHMETSLN